MPGLGSKCLAAGNRRRPLEGTDVEDYGRNAGAGVEKPSARRAP